MNKDELRFSDLTEYDKKLICNGCGPKSCSHKFPDYIFKESCNLHDFYYWRGGSEIDRIDADLILLTKMIFSIVDLENTTYWRRIYLFLWSVVYYLSCAIGGWSFFNYKRKKTINDLPSKEDGYY